MNAPQLFTREQVLDLLREVGAILQAEGLEGSLYIVGGAAMALVFDSRRTTRDVDAAISGPRDEFEKAVGVVAQRHGLAPDWLNSSAAAFAPSATDEGATEVSLPGLRVAVASAEHLLAMKLRALRRRDLADLVVLFKQLGIRTPEQAAAIHDRLFSDSDIGYAGLEESLYAARLVFDWAARQGEPLLPQRDV